MNSQQLKKKQFVSNIFIFKLVAVKFLGNNTVYNRIRCLSHVHRVNKKINVLGLRMIRVNDAITCYFRGWLLYFEG